MGKFIFSPVSVLLSKCSTVGQGRSEVRFLPGLVSLGRSFSCVWACISWIWRARGVRHNFGTLTPSPIFPKICHYFGTFTPSRIFPKICHNFGTFTPSRIFPKICHNFGTFHEYKLWELSFCVFVSLNLPHATVALLNSLYRAHKYFKLAGRGYECFFGAAGFALEKDRWYSVAKLTAWNYTTNPVAYFHMATHLVMLTLWRCPRCRPHGCSLLRPENCKPHSITAYPQFITTNITICLNANHFGEQLSVATFGSSFRLCRIALGRRFRVYIWRIAAFGQ